jgi:hypothetical protein
MPSSLVEVNILVEQITFSFKSKPRKIAVTTCCLLYKSFVFVQPSDSEDGSDKFLQNVNWLSDYIYIYQKRELQVSVASYHLINNHVEEMIPIMEYNMDINNVDKWRSISRYSSLAD